MPIVPLGRLINPFHDHKMARVVRLRRDQLLVRFSTDGIQFDRGIAQGAAVLVRQDTPDRQRRRKVLRFRQRAGFGGRRAHEFPVKTMRCGVADRIVGVIKIPECGQPRLIATQAPEHVFTDLIPGSWCGPDAYFVDFTVQKGIFLPNRAAQIIVIVIADRGEAARVRVLSNECAVQIEFHAAWAGDSGQVAPLIRS